MFDRGRISGDWQFSAPLSSRVSPHPLLTGSSQHGRTLCHLWQLPPLPSGTGRTLSVLGHWEGGGHYCQAAKTVPMPGSAQMLCSPEPSQPRGACHRLPGPHTRLHGAQCTCVLFTQCLWPCEHLLSPRGGRPRGCPPGCRGRAMGEGEQSAWRRRLPYPAWSPPPPGTNVGERAGGGGQGVTRRALPAGRQCAG